MPLQSFLKLNKLLVLVLLGGYVITVLEVRYVHDDILKEHRIAWTPIIYSLTMALLGAVALAFWERGGRRFLFWGFALGMVIGPVGFWLHTGGQPFQGVLSLLSVWGRSVGAAESLGGPPALAPLSLSGLGMLGMLACARRFQTDDRR